MGHLFLILIEKLINLKPTKANFKYYILLLITICLSLGYQYYPITQNKDYTKKYINKISEIKYLTKNICKKEKITSIGVFLIHNGIFTENRVHLMRYTSICLSDTLNPTTRTYDAKSINPYSDYFLEMYQHGHFYVKSTSKHPDILMNLIGQSIERETIVYLPIYSTQNKLIGFVTYAYVSETQVNINRLKRINIEICNLVNGLESSF